MKQNVIHRDVNPSNVFITYDGQVKIIDFGLAKAKNRVTETGLGVIKGKVAYMAPEQTRAARDLDHRADIFALGITLYELTTDKRLFKRSGQRLHARRRRRVQGPRPVDDRPRLLARALGDPEEGAREEAATTATRRPRRWPTALDAFSRSRGRVVTRGDRRGVHGGALRRAARALLRRGSTRSGPSGPCPAGESFRGPTPSTRTRSSSARTSTTVGVDAGSTGPSPIVRRALASPPIARATRVRYAPRASPAPRSRRPKSESRDAREQPRVDLGAVVPRRSAPLAVVGDAALSRMVDLTRRT